MIESWLLEIAVRGLVLAAAGCLAALVARRAPSSTRALVWAAVLVALVALPIVNLLLPQWKLPVLAANTPVDAEMQARDEAPPPASASLAGAIRPANRGPSLRPRERPPVPHPDETAGERPEGTAVAPAFAVTSTDPDLLLGITWLLVATALAARLATGVVRAHRLRTSAGSIDDGPVRDQFDAIARRTRVVAPALLRSDAVAVPVAVHVGDPAIIVPPGFGAWPRRQREAALLHELAHLQRYDCWVQVVARAAVALHWFNPLAWFAASRLWLERERACDDFVLLAGLRPSDYAEDLLAVATGASDRQHTSAALAFARRRHLADRVRSILSSETPRRSPTRRTLMTLTPVLIAALLPIAAALPVPATTPTAPATAATPIVGSEPAAPTTTAVPALPQDPTPSIDQLVKMRIHGVTPEYAAGMRQAFGAHLDIDDLIQARIHGVSTEFADEMARELGDDLDFAMLRKMRIHGVSAELVRAARNEVGTAVTADQVVKMRIHGITPESIAAMTDLLSYETIDVDDLVRMRIHGVDEEMVRDLQAAGYDDLTVDELVKIKIHGMERVMKRRSGGSR